MFNKKTRRNFRQRKDNSSEEEDEQKNNGDGEEKKKAPVLVNKPPHVSQSRGISCSSKREATSPKPVSSDEEDGETLGVTEEIEERKNLKTRMKGKEEKNNPVLSFSDDKEGNSDGLKFIYGADVLQNVVFHQNISFNFQLNCGHHLSICTHTSLCKESVAQQ